MVVLVAEKSWEITKVSIIDSSWLVHSSVEFIWTYKKVQRTWIQNYFIILLNYWPQKNYFESNSFVLGYLSVQSMGYLLGALRLT